MPDTLTAETPAPTGMRRCYTRGQVRAGDLVTGDVLLVPSAGWRELLDVWTDGEKAEAAAYAETAGRAAPAFIKQHLTGLSLYVVVHYLIEKPDAIEVTSKLEAFRRCDLVTVQVPDPTLDRLALCTSPTAPWPDTSRRGGH